MFTKWKCVPWCGLVLAASCGIAEDGESHRIDVGEANDLGITTILTARVSDDAGTVFTLQALASGDREVASLRLTTGAIADLPELLPGDDNLGSEIVITVAGTDTRTVTRETALFYFRDPTESPAVSRFVELPAVSAALEQYASFHVVAQPAKGSAGVDQSGEDPYYFGGCTAGQLLTTPVAKMCCYTDGNKSTNPNTYGGPGSLPLYTLFLRGKDTSCITRWHNPHNTACKAADGVSPCDGAACFYGPLGFSRPQVTSCTATPYIEAFYVWGSYAYCAPGKNNYGNPDLSGTGATGQGCPGSNGGSGARAWDY